MVGPIHGHAVARQWWENPEWLTVIVLGVAAALSGALLVTEVIGRVHDRAMSGTAHPLIAKRGRQTLPWSEFEPAVLPEGWHREHLRWVPMRLINRATFAVAVLGPTEARIGWLRRRVDVSYSTNVIHDEPQTVAVIINRPEGWSARKTVRISLTWEYADEKLRFRGRVTPKIVPPKVSADATN
jgi:hypothetical protein